jgi:hypothetical protein
MVDYRKIQLYIPYLFLAFFIFLIFPNYFYALPVTGLDNSWNIALHLAHRDHFIHGKDFVFTYGPLGVLNSRYSISVNLFVYLIFDIYFLAVIFYILKDVLKKRFSYGLAIFIFITIITSMYEGIYQWHFFFFLYFLFSFLKQPRNFSFLLHAGILSLICFYFKVSFGIVAIVVFLMTIGYTGIRKRISLRSVAVILGVYILSLWLSSKLLLVDLKGYVVGALELIDGYNDAMFTELSPEYKVFSYLATIAVFIAVFYIVWLFILSIRKKNFVAEIDQFFIYGIIGLTIFIVFKSGFVRADSHIFVFFKGICLIMPLFYLFSNDAFQRKAAALCCWFVLAICFFAVNAIPGSYRPYTRILTMSIVPIKIGEIKTYFKGIMDYNKAVEDSKRLYSGTNDLKKIIGSHSVDVVPSEISKVYFNGLRYNPRPVIQSYSAYGKYLDDLNYDKYTSDNAPDYILFDLKSIDDRFPYFDESKTKLAILTHYDVVDEYEGDLILKRRVTPDKLIPRDTQEIIDAKMGDDVPIEENDGLQYSKLLVNYDFPGKLRRLFFIPPELKITITLENGEARTYKVIKPIIANGVVLNKFVDNELEFKLLMLGGGVLNTPVKKIRLEADSLNPGFLANYKIVNTFYDLSSKSAARKVADSLSIANMLQQYKPSEISSEMPEQERFRYHIENLSTHGQFFRIAGWAFLEKADNSKSVTKILLKSANKLYELPTVNVIREDLPTVFEKKDLTNAGFISTVSRSLLPGGVYQVGIAIYDSKARKRTVNFTDYNIQVKTTFEIEKTDPVKLSLVNKKNTRANFDLVKETENHITLEGWAVADKEDTRTSSTFLILQNKEGTYRVAPERRRRIDISANFKNPLFEYSGFFAEIPKNKLPKGMYSIGVEKKYGDNQSGLIFMNEKIRFGYPDAFTPVVVTTLPPARDIFLGIDSVNDNETFITVSGWAVQRMDNVSESTVKIVLKSDDNIYVSDTEPTSRPDVTAHFKTKFNLDNSGFQAKISKSTLKKGKYQLGILISQKGNTGTMKLIDRFAIK